MKKNSSGFIFLMTLFVILVISILLLTCSRHILFYHKALNQQEQSHQRFYQLEELAGQLVHTPLIRINKSCIEIQDMPNEVIQLLIQGQGCLLTVGHAKYRYFIEDLGDFPCHMIQNQQKNGAHHIRISILLLATEAYPSSLLQIRVIKPPITPAFCEGETRMVREGISSWRYLSAR